MQHFSDIFIHNFYMNKQKPVNPYRKECYKTLFTNNKILGLDHLIKGEQLPEVFSEYLKKIDNLYRFIDPKMFHLMLITNYNLLRHKGSLESIYFDAR